MLGLSDDLIREKIESRDIKICVVGLGKMGLPLSTVFTHAGFRVNGLDVSENLINSLNRGETTINEPFVADRLRNAVDNNLFFASIDVRIAIKDVSFIIFIIPVLTKDDGHADISILEKTYNKIKDHSKKGVIYIQESTLPPMTTSGPLRNLLESNGDISGKDFGLVFAPERTFSGRVVQDIEDNYPKILGGDTDNAAIAASILYEQICKKGVMKLSSATAAEAVKTFKGAYRDVNIAIANEFAKMSDIYGIDILEVIDAANSEPFSHIHKPGIGVGGHCIPVYPRFLIAQSIDYNYKPNVLDISRNLNDSMVNYAIDTLDKYIDDWNTPVLVLGLAYRGGVKEYRLSPTLRLVPQLRLKGADVTVMDPLFDNNEINALFGENTASSWSIDSLDKYKIIIICTDHNEFYILNEFLENKTDKIVFDGRYVINIFDNNHILQPGRLIFDKHSK